MRAHDPARPGGTPHRQPAGPDATPHSRSEHRHQLGFHPGLAGLSDSTISGKVAVIQGCGYPEYNLSHDVSRSIWQRGAPLGTPSAPAGWAAISPPRTTSAATFPAVNIGGEVAGEYLQTDDQRARLRPPARLRLSRTTSRSTTTTTSTTRRSRTPCSTRSTTPRPPTRTRSCSTSAAPAPRRWLATELLPAAAHATTQPTAQSWSIQYYERPTRRPQHQHGAPPARDRQGDLRRRARQLPERQRALLRARQRRLRHALRSGRRRPPAISTTTLHARSATR